MMNGDSFEFNTVCLFGLEIANLTMIESCEITDEFINCKTRYRAVFTPNASMTVQAIEDKSFYQTLKRADLLLPDGISLVLASKILKNPLKEKVSGSTFFIKSCEYFAQKKRKIFLLGAAEGVAIKAASNLKAVIPNLNIVGCYSPPYRFENNPKENQKVISILKKASADVLFVAMSNGRGERWIIENKEKYRIPVSIQLGASFDFAAGIKSIPPEFIKKLGVAWLWRLLSEPKRLWKRYFFEDSKIIYYTFKEKIKRNK